MKVNVSDLCEGYILAEDVMGMTSSPIIPKKTTINQEHIDVLKAFSKDEVIIENKISTSESAKAKGEKENQRVSLNNDTCSSFYNLYVEAVKRYKADFQTWQSGAPINIAGVRDYLYTLMEKAEEEGINISPLHHYSNKEEYLYNHSITVGLISGLMAKKMGYDKGQYYQTALAGCLANVGMAKISPRILMQSSFLSKEDNIDIKNHPNHSLKMVQNSPLLKSETKLAIFQHHERLDGSGYPMGVKDKQIYPISRIVAVADVFHALTSERLYKVNIASFKALEILKIDGFGQFDISVINTLIMLVANLSIGTKVKLSNGQFGEVIFTKQSSPTRPLVKLKSGEIIDLEKTREIHIEEIY